MADKVKTVVRDSTGLIVQTIESDSDNPLVPRVRDLEKALAIQLEHDRLLEARYMDFTASLMRETREQRDLAGVAGPHLDHRRAVRGAQSQQGQRDAPVVVEIPFGLERRHRGSECRRHEILGGGLS